jgi:hypothetical protein
MLQMDLLDSENKKNLALNLPTGWTRFIEMSNKQEKCVVYKSPTGIKLKSLSDVRNYLLSDGTCKCGFECPFYLDAMFSFDPNVFVESNTIRTKFNSKSCKHSKEHNSMNQYSIKSIEPRKYNSSLLNERIDSETAFKQNDSFETYPNENYFVNLSSSNKNLLESSFSSPSAAPIFDVLNSGCISDSLNNVSNNNNSSSYHPETNQNHSINFADFNKIGLFFILYKKVYFYCKKVLFALSRIKSQGSYHRFEFYSTKPNYGK